MKSVFSALRSSGYVSNGKTTFQRFMLVFFSFVLLFMLLLLPVYHYTEDMAHQAEVRRCETRLQNGILSLESSITALHNMGQSLTSDTMFLSMLRLNKEETPDVFNLIRMGKSFNGLAISIPLAAEVGLIIREDVLFTKGRFFYSNHYSFYSSFMQCGEMTYQQWYDALIKNAGSFMAESPYTSEETQSYDALTYTVRWPTTYSSSECLLFAIFPTEKVMALMADDDILSEGYLIITDKSGQILAWRGEKSTQCATEITASLSNMRATVTVGIPPSVLGQRLTNVKRLIFSYIVSVLIIACIAIIFFSWHSAKPMRHLLSMVSNESASGQSGLFPQKPTPRLQKDYKFLANNMLAMTEQMQKYKNTLETQRSILSAGIWEKAMTRGLNSLDEMLLFSDAFPAFPQKWRLAAIRFSETDAIAENVDIQIRLCANLKLLAEHAIAQAVETGTIVMVMDAATDIDPAMWENQLSAESTGIPVIACAVSDMHQGLEPLHHAYQHISELLYLPGKLPFIRQAQDRPGASIRIPISIPDTEILYNTLRTGKLESALHILENCVKELRESDDCALLARFIYNQIINVLARIKLENLSDMFELTLPLYNDQQRNELFSQELPACFQKICDINAQQREACDNRARRIIEYVDAHITDSEISICEIEDKFKLSPPTLQKLVRSVTGTTLANYIDARRIELANRLLQEKRLSVNEIATRCGYSSVNSFYKAFKRHYGVAPSHFQEASQG